jgi:UDPglucose--hexose-1-phosphate uridylyltransferase
VCFSPEHSGSFGTQTRTRARTVIEAWADRTAALSALPGVEQVFPFENRGEAIGVTLPHPHGQIYAYPYITPRTSSLLASIEREGHDLFARILDFERNSERVILEGEHWTAFVPFAARWPLEVHLLPHRHVPDFAATSHEERDELAPLYLRLLRGVDALYETPTPYIAAWHQAPVRRGRETVRLHLQLTSPRRAADKLKFLAGSEAAMGAWIGDIPPETSAARLRDAVASIPEVAK